MIYRSPILFVTSTLYPCGNGHALLSPEAVLQLILHGIVWINTQPYRKCCNLWCMSGLVRGCHHQVASQQYGGTHLYGRYCPDGYALVLPHVSLETEVKTVQKKKINVVVCYVVNTVEYLMTSVRGRNWDTRGCYVKDTRNQHSS